MSGKEKKRARGSSSTADEDISDAMILEKLSNIHDDIKALKEELKGEVKAVRTELCEATKSLTAVWEEVQSLKAENQMLKEQCNTTTKENDKLNKEIATLKNRVIKMEDYSRRENLRVYNIPENPGESIVECKRKVTDILKELGADPGKIMFHAIHRIGKIASSNASTGAAVEESRPPRPRPVIVRFLSRMDCDWVFENRRKLSASPNFSSVFIDKDLSAESARERGKLRSAYNKAKEMNIARAFIKGKNLIVNSSRYTADNLPEYLLPQRNGSG